MKTEEAATVQDNDYAQRAQDFLTRNGLTFRASWAIQKCPPWAGGERERGACARCGTTHGQTFAITIRRTATGKRLTFPFWGSFKDGSKTPRPYVVLACISGDTFCPDTFEEFVAEYGYDNDSLSAWRTFKRCAAFGERLRAFFTDAEQSELAEIN